jgi:putative membrane protein
MRRGLLRLLINTLALFAAVVVIPGVRFDGPLWHLVVVAALFGAVNAVLRPFLYVLTCPLVVVTLGGFALVVNAALFALTARLAGTFGIGFTISGFWAALGGALVTSVAAVLVALLITPEPARVRDAPRA